MASNRVDYFGAGPAALPVEVLEEAQAELLNFQGSGMSMLELSHRSNLYRQVHDGAIDSLRDLMAVPSDYSVLLLQGGASLQFAMLPMNFLSKSTSAAYILTGTFSEKAFKEAVRFGEARAAASSKEAAYSVLPTVDSSALRHDDAYVHFTSNNTIVGSQWQTFPDVGEIPLVADMSSDILSRPVDVSKFTMIYAGAQKNLGPAGLTVVIAKKAWLEQGHDNLATMLSYRTHLAHDSLFNTPPTYSIYVMSLVLKWLRDSGGVTEAARRNDRKAALIYNVIDESDGWYRGHVEKAARSRMNVTFRLPSADLEAKFLAQAADAGFVGLNGHRSIGGCRVSLYNAVSYEAAARLAEFMRDFHRSM